MYVLAQLAPWFPGCCTLCFGPNPCYRHADATPLPLGHTPVQRARAASTPRLAPACSGWAPCRLLAAAQSYDVWNEIFHLRKYADACELWDNTFKDAFKWVNDIDPDAKLCINE